MNQTRLVHTAPVLALADQTAQNASLHGDLLSGYVCFAFENLSIRRSPSLAFVAAATGLHHIIEQAFTFVLGLNFLVVHVFSDNFATNAGPALLDFDVIKRPI